MSLARKVVMTSTSVLEWVGPFKIRDYLEKAIDEDQVWPPESGGVYVVSLRRWNGRPTKQCDVLYVGSNTGASNRFITRIGDLIADMLGFWGEQTGHHSGGQSLWKYCREHGINPL